VTIAARTASTNESTDSPGVCSPPVTSTLSLVSSIPSGRSERLAFTSWQSVAFRTGYPMSAKANGTADCQTYTSQGWERSAEVRHSRLCMPALMKPRGWCVENDARPAESSAGDTRQRKVCPTGSRCTIDGKASLS
jgi:hypothetical protein